MRWATLTARLHVLGFWFVLNLLCLRIDGASWLFAIGWATLVGGCFGWFFIWPPLSRALSHELESAGVAGEEGGKR